MAFVNATPLLKAPSASRQLSSPTRPRHTLVAMAERPTNFATPDPRTYFIRPDKAMDIASLGLSGMVRLWTGALVEGYRLKREDGKVVEYSSTLPMTRPEKPLHVFEFEACPFCRRVREAITMLDLDVIFFPCPKNGALYRSYVISNGGKAQFPYMEDPNTGFAGFESDEIIRYLYSTYGPTGARIPPTLSSVGTLSAGIASSVRPGKGRERAKKTVPAKKLLELWAYEASPFCKLVRETLTELELAHLIHTAARGSPTRGTFKEANGRFQVPFLIDPNTGVSMFESAEICEYLLDTYGPTARGAVANPDPGAAYQPGDPVSPEMMVDTPAPSLDPQPVRDASLEEYCKDNPDADECRLYDN